MYDQHIIYSLNLSLLHVTLVDLFFHIFFTKFFKIHRSSWIIKTNNMTYFFGGDTGYCGDMFRLTGTLYPVDFAAIPIGAYGT